jgi:hypothetical protein
VKVLKRRGLVETGGILMGEHVAADEFRIVDFTVQHAEGALASFLRIPQIHLRALNQFFRSTGRDYRKFNYLGEWHSHPAFSTRPSASDLASMYALVNDAATGATFAVLMIVRLDREVTLQTGTYLFVPGNPTVHAIPLVLETDQAPGVRLARKGGARIGLVSNPDVAGQMWRAD